MKKIFALIIGDVLWSMGKWHLSEKKTTLIKGRVRKTYGWVGFRLVEQL